MDNIESFLNKLHHPALAGIDLSLDRMLRLLSMLGSPHKRLPPVVHAAGTNGKGSLLAYVQAIFEAAGYRVHKYTSPHLVHFREQIILQGREIENGHVENIIRYITPVLAAQPATFFEATTAIAFLAFAEHKADILLLETGLGGRLDATNVIEKPLLTVITPIAYDHCEYLGNTLTAIAGEKAGILKHGVPCVVGKQVEEAAAVIEKQAAALTVPLYRYGKEWHVENEIYHSRERTLALHPSLAGDHQFDNAAAAVASIEQMPQFAISGAHITQGLAHAVWPARLQQLTHGGYIDILPPGIELWLDGGHNPQGGEVLAAWLQGRAGCQTYLVCGMTNNKDMAG
ncbi:MAG: bifunctional folylpolyglutamate synthase/dihydrofolate synthase, partial [Pseudomonadota bacterium]|nr:bifunctional folylpolyglutamate synthase/dihydrofolate synthase [Pseudomonadota bacterium]